MYEYIYDKRELHESAIFEVEITRRNLETLWRKRNFLHLKILLYIIIGHCMWPRCVG